MARVYNSPKQEHIKAYRNADLSIRRKINRRLEKYLKDPNTSLDSLAKEIAELLDRKYAENK